jgi:hypothetical protein
LVENGIEREIVELGFGRRQIERCKVQRWYGSLLLRLNFGVSAMAVIRI